MQVVRPLLDVRKLASITAYQLTQRVKFANAKNYSTEQLQNLAEAYDKCQLLTFLHRLHTPK